jgi:acetyl-CoA carboxylase biotin carboxyl carrier protein
VDKLLKVSDIREFIRLLDETSLHELHIEAGDVKVTLKKAPQPPVHAGYAGHVESRAPQAVPAAAVHPEGPPPLAAPAPEDTVRSDGTALITSPMVGTFYRSPAPTSPPFVEAGSKVTEKTVVCIVEAMKLMNEIEADMRGEIIEILAENGQLVEYGQPLFRVRLA